MEAFNVAFSGVVIIITFLLTALCWLIIFKYVNTNSKVKRKKKLHPASVMIVAGSGGHTTEIMNLVKALGRHYHPRMYIIANTDKMSESKILELEEERKDKTEFHIYRIPRSREVKQSWLTSILSTVYATVYTLPLVVKLNPDVILCNGPGTCLPVCVGGLLNKLLFRSLKIIYVESICRITTLSLSGKLLYNVADAMFVQWPFLQKKYPKTIYIGRL